ncbi:hypothetical protein SAMN05216227_11021 [Pseudorhodobacter antarcticus]|uniref:DUF4325 domain-containing protein n=2 Tax=Pseudorhodobacter antarcticus TaxID=1077947 RepID=A0A1H8NU78_9RHOB|nr:hypothetical protein SAMN05216227_11021 [Pseudorhodobacter antarcticus]
MTKIDLVRLTKNKVRMLTGQIRGVESRALYSLDELEASGSPIQICAPESLEAITTSFVQGFLGATVYERGDEAVDALYDFSLLPKTLEDDFRVGIERLKLHSAARRRESP